MKCPGCQKNHKKKDGMTCTCGYRFVFDPSIDNNWTDSMFLSLLNRASHNETYYFTRSQLLTYAFKKRSFLSYFTIRDAVLSVIVGLIFGAFTIIPLLGIIAAAIVLLITAFWKGGSQQMTSEELDSLLNKWKNGGKTIPFMMTKPSLDKPPPQWKEKDIYDYGINRLIITDEDILVDVLIKNNFHADQHAVVISETGYPRYLEKHVKKISKDNPDLKVYLLHAVITKEEGKKMKERIMKKYDLHEKNITDLGLYDQNLPVITRKIHSRPEGAFDHAPADFIPFPFLSALLILSMESDAEFMEVLDSATEGEYDNSTIAGDFG